MDGAEVRPFLARIREAIAARVHDSSLRQAARDLGVTPTGLQYFLDGGAPQGRTRRKFEAWYLENQAGLDPDLQIELEGIALAILTRGLPPGQRLSAAEGTLASLSAAYLDAGLPVPPWILLLEARLAGDQLPDK